MSFIEDLQEELPKLEKTGLESTLLLVKFYLDNPEMRLFVSIGNLVDALSKEIDMITSKGATTIINGEDKVFERVQSIIIRYGEFCSAMKSGRELQSVKKKKLIKVAEATSLHNRHTKQLTRNERYRDYQSLCS